MRLIETTSEMGETSATTNGVLPTEQVDPKTARAATRAKKAASARPVRAIADAVENPARKEFGFPPADPDRHHAKKTSGQAGKKTAKTPHKVSASPKKKMKASSTHHTKKPVKAKASAKAGIKGGKKAHAKPKKHAHASSKLAAKKHGPKKRPAHWTDTKAQLVMHATPELVAKLDRALTRLGKKFKLERATRGSVVRALVEQAVKGK